MRLRLWDAKSYYNLGDYKTALEKVESSLEFLEDTYVDLKKDLASPELKPKQGLKLAHIKSLEADSNVKIQQIESVEVPDFAAYAWLKLKLQQARINKAIGMNNTAHEVCNQIFLFVKTYQEKPAKKFLLTAVKAAWT